MGKVAEGGVPVRLMRQTRCPLVEALKRYVEKGYTPFHTPGHLQGGAAPPVLRRWWGRSVFSADLTEVPGLDDLQASSGVIREAEELAAKLAGAENTFFLVNGSTAGNLAMIMAAAGPGDKVVLPRTIHRSAVAALVLSGAEPVFLPVRWLEDFEIPLPPEPAVYRDALAERPEARAVFSVYPDYYGVAVDLEAVAREAHSLGLPLLVDAAHGVLFGRHAEMPPGAMACGADASVESVHKRAGALTQAAWLLVQGNRVSPARIRDALRLVTTSSPSYLLLASLDAARRQLAASGESLCRRIIELAVYARAELARCPGVSVLSAAGESYRVDQTRLVLNFRAAGISGFTAAKLMRRSGVVAEMADFHNVVLLLSPGHRMRDIKTLVCAVRKVLDKTREQVRAPRFPQAPPARLSPREAWLAPSRAVPPAEATGLVSAEIVAPAPPGIPVLLPGEEVTAEAVAYLYAVRAAGARVQGAQDPELNTILVVR
ncbi:MAG: aminotransferase class I/II-fold pyridoxal phosphate-dependent enzyme [Bacillota bacterium]